ALEEELGDLLFAVVNLARPAGAHARAALQRANRKFSARFEALERLAAERAIELGEASLEELDRLWGEGKRGEARKWSGAALGRGALSSSCRSFRLRVQRCRRPAPTRGLTGAAGIVIPWRPPVNRPPAPTGAAG